MLAWGKPVRSWNLIPLSGGPIDMRNNLTPASWNLDKTSLLSCLASSWQNGHPIDLAKTKTQRSSSFHSSVSLTCAWLEVNQTCKAFSNPLSEGCKHTAHNDEKMRWTAVFSLYISRCQEVGKDISCVDLYCTCKPSKFSNSFSPSGL
jgi:hypothetical protein